MRTDIPARKEEILQWIKEHRTKVYIYHQLKCKPVTLDSWLKKMDIEYKGNIGGKGYKCCPQRKSAIEYSKTNSPKSYKLKIKLIEDNLRQHRCYKCSREIWMGEKIPIELHHKDGDHFNNDMDNLEIICPNCHAQQPGNSGASIGQYKGGVPELAAGNRFRSGWHPPMRVRVSSPPPTIPYLLKRQIFCIDCKSPISSKATRCKSCSQMDLRTKIDWPSDKDLVNMVLYNPYTTVAKRLGVSDNAIRHRLKRRGLL